MNLPRRIAVSAWDWFIGVTVGENNEDLSLYGAADAIGRSRLESRVVVDVGAFRVLERMRERERKHADSLRFLRGKRA